MRKRVMSIPGHDLWISLLSLLICMMLLPPETFGRHRGSIRSGQYYYEHDRGRLEQQRIAAEEERRREASREKRHAEIDKERNRKQKEFLEFREAILSSSRAAIKAPRGFYYRRPGATMSQLPQGSVEIDVEGRKYHYFSGVYFRLVGNRYSVANAPVGALIDALPTGYGTTNFEGMVYFYYFGTFYLEEGERYRVVNPPAGVAVGYLPDGYSEVQETDSDRVTYEFGGIRFRAYFLEGILVYVVIGT